MCAFHIMWRRPSEGRKVFFLGFNKCATKSLHDLFAGAGYRSAHARIKRITGRKDNLAVLISENVAAGRPVLDGAAGFDVFSDLTSLTSQRLIEANRFYKELFAEYPDAYYILNTRPIEDWIRSRSYHANAQIGSFLERYMHATGLDQTAAINQWRADFQAHHDEVTRFFATKGRFMQFDIRSDVTTLIDLVRPDYRLNAGRWRQLGRTADRNTGRPARL